MPHAKADVPLNGIEVAEWGCHDRHFGFHTWPSALAAKIDSAFGLHRVLGMDAYSIREWAPDDYAHREAALRTPEEDATLLNGLLHGVKAKRKLNADLLADGDWDLFLTVFGESHAVGHQRTCTTRLIRDFIRTVFAWLAAIRSYKSTVHWMPRWVKRYHLSPEMRLSWYC